MEIPLYFGRNVRLYQIACDIPHKAIAEALDMPVSSVSRFVNGHYAGMSDEKLEKLAGLFDVPLDKFLKVDLAKVVIEATENSGFINGDGI